MLLDASTLLLVTVILTFMVGSLFLLSWSQARHVHALAIWGAAHITGAMASALLSLRGIIPDWASIGVANGVMIGAYGLIWIGTRAFEGRPARLMPIAVAVVLWSGSCLIPAFFTSVPARVMLASSLAGGFCLLAAREIWRARAEPLVSRYPGVALLLLYTVAYWIRVPLAIAAPPQTQPNPLQTPWLTILCLAGMLFTLAIAFVFMSLTKERAERLQRLAADTDALTGILSRRAFVARAETALTDGGDVTLLLFDLDHFKRINDVHGHAVGDGVLVGFCHAVAALLPGSAIFGRMGGEEFACLLRGLTPEDALAKAEFLRRAVARIAVSELPQLAISVSIGLATAEAAASAAPGRRLDALLSRADAALYRAKRNGRGRTEPAPRPLRRVA
ncbi:dethiobiotin synthetase [Methylobacterium sp. Leaf104]|uniref:GGDEF domain-containing protein n=1 Tax=Methylobacterium TaxID=407 RepID=UPI0006F1C511|nr:MULTISPECIES: GGDEF domain-containing protein [Methylobacterium]KQP30742.1 dethiobiotin synthetase [Methylobacterium sp. Leaf104]MCI9882284.1 GGDEF domain-containing protein [Methylobacterium goesingense]